MKQAGGLSTFQVNPDKSFECTGFGLSWKGTYTLAGNTATFDTRTVNGRDVSSSSDSEVGAVMIGTLSADGKTFTLADPNVAGPPSTFTKASS